MSKDGPRRKRHEDHSQVINELANEIRACYIRERRRAESLRFGHESEYRPTAFWDGGETRDGTRRKSVWHSLANFLQTAAVDVEAYVRWRFAHGSLSYILKPNALLDPAAVEEFRASRESTQAELRTALDFQKRLLVMEIYKLHEMEPDMSEEDLAQSVLLDGSIELSALFRYSVARGAGYKSLASCYREAAINQYLQSQEAYDAVWGPFIPEKLKLRAKEIHQGYFKRKD